MPTQETMTRRLGLPSVIAICLGAMFSSGFFLLPGLAAQHTGPAIPLAYLVAGIVVLPALLSLAELSSAMPRSGGPYHFLARGLGPLAGVLGGIGKYVSLLFKGAFAFVGVGAYLSLVVDVPVQPVALALVAVFTAVNLLGVKQTARIEIWLVAVLFVILLAFLVAGGVEAVGRGGGPPGEALFPRGMSGFLAAVALVFVSYSGVGQVASAAEEIREPARNIPLGMLVALALATVVYGAGTLVMVALLGPEPLGGDPAPVATAAAEFTALPLPSVVIVAAALAAFVSTGNAAILSAARYPLAMARDGVLGNRFARVSERGVPRTGVLVTGGLLALAILTFDVEGLAKLASAFLLLVFAGVCLTVVVFRESASAEYEPGFRSPAYPWMHLAGVLTYGALIVESDLEAVGMILLLLVAGGAWYVLRVRARVEPSGAIYRWFGHLAERAGSTPERTDKACEDAAALRRAPLRNVQVVTVTLRADDGSGLVEVPLRDADLPRGVAVALVRRRGASFVPHGDDILEVGDEATLVVEAERIGDVEHRFGGS